MARSANLTSGPLLFVLVSLSGGEKHGHALMKDIFTFTGARLGTGTLYGAITRLESRGLIVRLVPDARRQPYAITDAGRLVLESSLNNLQRVIDAGVKRHGTPLIRGSSSPLGAKFT